MTKSNTLITEQISRIG